MGGLVGLSFPLRLLLRSKPLVYSITIAKDLADSQSGRAKGLSENPGLLRVIHLGKG
jgi:hypothetical protein